MHDQSPITAMSMKSGVAHVTLSIRRLIDTAEIRQFTMEVTAHMNNDIRAIVIDFDGTEYLGSLALNQLMILERQCLKEQKKFVLCNLRPEIYEVFIITRLNQRFTIVQKYDDALAAIN